MKFFSKVLPAVFIFIHIISAQIVITMDNDTAGFEASSGWNLKELRGSYGGTAYFKSKGDGNEIARWNINLKFPGLYQIETYSIDYEFAKDSRWTINTTSGDTLVYADLYHSPGWNSLGAFSLPETTSVLTSDYFESDSGQYVIADAIRLTGQMDLFTLSGELNLAEGSRLAETELSLYRAGTSNLLKEKIIEPQKMNFNFQNLPKGYYKVQCVRWGFDTLTVDSIEIIESDKSLSPFDLERSPAAQYSISGQILYSDENDTASCRIELSPKDKNIIVGLDSAQHEQNYQFNNLPPGEYCLKFRNTGYTNDFETYEDLTVSESDLELTPLTFQVEFKIAWITDSHIGLSFTNPGIQEVVDSINAHKSKVDFVIHTGDVTEKGKNSELSTANRYLNKCQIPMYVIPGNHDSKWTESGMESYEKYFGEMYYSFDHKGFHFIGLNNAIYFRGGGGYFDPVQLDWLKKDLASMEDPNTPVIVFYHLPSVQNSVNNSWKVLDILKDYRTALILVGHGHSNRTYNFEGIPGLMAMDTYSSGNSGFTLISLSKKNIVVKPFYTETGLGAPWYKTECADSAQPDIKFINLNNGETISAEKTIDIQLDKAATNGNYQFHKNGSGTLEGSGKNWNFTIKPQNMPNGYHTVTFNFSLENGISIKRSCCFYTENGDYPKALWRYQSGAEVITRPAFDSSQAYIGTGNGEIHAINLDDGSQVWTPIITDSKIFSSPTVDDSTLYIGSSDGKLYAVATNSGNVNWTYDAGAALLNPVIVKDSLIYFAAKNKMYALNKYTQEKSWIYSTGQMIECEPTIVDDKIIFSSWDTKVYCLNRMNGNELWKWNRQSRFYYSPAACWPVANDKYVFVVDPERYISALNINNGNVVWQNDNTEVWESIGTNQDKTQIYTRTLDGYVYTYDATTPSCNKLWQTSINYGWDSTPSMPVGIGGLVLSGCKAGFVFSAGQNDGSLKWKYWASHSYITTVNPIDEDHVLAAALDGSVTLIEGDPGLSIHQTYPNNLPHKNQLYTPYPNPFNQSVNIEYSINKPQTLQLTIYDLNGRKIFNKNLNHSKNGRYKFIWQGKNDRGNNISTGLYFIKLRGNNFQKTRKILLLK